MRRIAIEVDPIRARRFGAALDHAAIKHQLDQRADGAIWIWVIEEADVGQASALYLEFQADPEAEHFRSLERQRPPRPAPEAPPPITLGQTRDNRGRSIQFNMRFQADISLQPVTGVLIGLCVLVAILSFLGSDLLAIEPLFFTHPLTPIAGTLSERLAALTEIRSGQVWRIFTPMLIHFGFFHILFNMWWLKDLGSQIEYKSGPLTFILLTLVCGGLANIAQYLISGSASFGGMSGQVYAMVGYLWMKSKYDPGSGLFLRPDVVFYMIIWFIVCFFLPHVANTAHAVGLFSGMAWGWLSAKRNMAAHHLP